MPASEPLKPASKLTIFVAPMKPTGTIIMAYQIPRSICPIKGIVNAVSPAFTCSFPFADWVLENYLYTNKTVASSTVNATKS